VDERRAYEDIRPFNPAKKDLQTDESSDTYDTIDWLVKNMPANNGNVGVFGISYPGFYSTMAALSNHPALKAVSPQAPVTDWFIGDDFHHNGAFFLLDCFSFYTSGFGYPHPKPTKLRSGFHPENPAGRQLPDISVHWHPEKLHETDGRQPGVLERNYGSSEL
jgi:predicted acyl esterase